MVGYLGEAGALTTGARVSACLLLLCVCPAYAKAQAVTCESMSLDPVVSDDSTPEGLGILDRYYVSAESFGGVICWVHPHSNGRDFVITPPGWGQVPKPEQQGWIDLTMKAITDLSDRPHQDRHAPLELVHPADGSYGCRVGEGPVSPKPIGLLDKNCWVEARQDSRSSPVGDARRSRFFQIQPSLTRSVTAF